MTQKFWGLSQFEMFVFIWWSYLWLLFQYEESVFIISKFLSISAVSKNLSPTSMFPFWGFLRKAYVTYLLSQIEKNILWWPMGFCKIDSDLWTIFLFYTQRLAFGMLCMIGLVIFDKTDHWPRKSIFHDQTTKQLSLKISELVQDNLKIFVGGENSPFHPSGDEKLDRFDYWLYQNRLVQIGQLDRKDTLETISMNRINFTYSSSRNIYK